MSRAERTLSEGQKLRVAVGAVNDFDQLRNVVDQLTGSNVGLGDLVVLTPPCGLCERLLKAAQLDNGQNAHTLPMAVVHQRGERTLPGHLPAQHGGNTALMELAMRFEDWIDDNLARRLDQAMSKGACLLFVRVASIDLEVAISIALLSHSTDGIQLHDVKIPR